MSEFYNMDCMKGMKQFPDDCFDLAIVDPPYGSSNICGGYTSGKGGGVAGQKKYNEALWKQSAPTKEYFEELKRVSKNQIIWGANHFIANMPYNSPCWIIWDKDNGDVSFADCELAYTSFDKAARKFKYRWAGMLQENMKNKEIRIHPTQKPVALYVWLLTNYANKGDKILDTHVGSASSLIACEKLGFEYVGFELDKDYYEAAKKRIHDEMSQTNLFDKF